jgi:NTE family protein
LSKKQITKKLVNLALQGGGAHGAFTWGVLDRFLEDERIEIDSITGTSAGAMNAVVCASGLMKNGVEGARENLDTFWRKISKSGNGFKLVYHSPFQKFFNLWNSDMNISYRLFEHLTRVFSPYMLNPYGYNPLKDILEETVDFELVRKCDRVNIFIGTTHVRTGKPRVFHNQKLSSDVVLASACLPFLFPAVKVEGEYYWDGGYTGNPPIFPLISRSKSHDVIVVHINPMIRDELPVTPNQIVTRVNEISFNSALMREFRAIDFVIRLLEEGWLKEEFRPRLRHLLVHSISADQSMKNLGKSSKYSSDWAFLSYLKDLGRSEASQFLDKNFDKLGIEATVNLRDTYIDKSSTTTR